jgi:hypothetical protein
MSAEKLRERFQSWVRLLFTSMQSTDKIIVSPSGKSSTNQLPALPIPLELVYRKNDDCGLNNILSFRCLVELVAEYLSATVCYYSPLRLTCRADDGDSPHGLRRWALV